MASTTPALTLALAMALAGGALTNATPSLHAGAAAPAEAFDEEAYRAQIERWHAQRIENLRRPDGWLSLVGLYAIDDGVWCFGASEDCALRLESVPTPVICRLIADGNSVRAEAVADLRVHGQPVTAIALEPDTSGEPTILEHGTLRFYLILRNGRPYLRVKDTASPLREHFEGIERWPVDPRWRIEGRWRAFDEPYALRVPSVLGDVEIFDCPGAVEFEIDGRTTLLMPTSIDEDSMFFVFGDETNGVESYGGGRFLSTERPDEQGRVIMDFNRAYDPPCAFTPYATCPLPPEENQLPVAVTAGEKMYGHAH